MENDTRLKCVNCGNKWTVEQRIDDDFDADMMCPDCNWAASAWNFIPEYEEE